MSPPTSRARLLGTTAISLLLMISGGCTNSASTAPSVTALDYDTHQDFPINSGAHAKADCNTCHGDFGTFKQFTCTSCHEHDQAVTDPKHVGVAGYTWSGTSCYDCHLDGTATMVNHAQYFPIGSGTMHDNISCATCHVDPTNRKNVDCISCHTHNDVDTNAIHDGIPNYAYTSPKCLECHPKGDITGVDHTFFPIGSGTVHTGISCSSCHPDRTNRKNVDCISCHTHEPVDTNAIHAGIPNYDYTNAKCMECHPNGDIPGIDHTPYFPTKVGETHGGSSCRSCHPDRTNRKLLNCLTCHPATTADAQHVNVGGYAQDSSLCIRCHGDSQVNAVATHLPFLVRSGARHYKSSCLTCHPANRTDKTWATNFTPFDCLGCHKKTEMDGHHASISGYQYVSTTCVNSGCHPSGRAP